MKLTKEQLRTLSDCVLAKMGQLESLKENFKDREADKWINQRMRKLRKLKMALTS